MKKQKSFDPIRDFDSAPDSMLVSIETAGTVLNRSRASIYRHVQAGELSIIKVGCSSRLSVGNLRRLMHA